MSYTCHLPGLVYTWYIPCHWFKVYTGYIPGICLSNEIVRSARQQNCDSNLNAAAHRNGIARVFNVLQNVAVPLGIRPSQPGQGSGQTRVPAAKSPRRRRWHRHHRRPLQQRWGRAAAAADAVVGCAGGVTQPPPTPTAMVARAHLRRRRQRSESLVD